SRNISRDDNRCPKFSDGARESEEDPGNNAARRERNRNRKKDARIAGSQRSRNMFKPLIHTLKSNPRRTHQERKRHDGSGSNNSAQGEDNIDPQVFVQKSTDSAATAEEF